MTELDGRVRALLYREARYLDERRFQDWLGLFTEDAVYWIPAGGDEPDPQRQVSLVHDDRARLEMRVGRLTGGFAHAQEPPSRVHRSVSNIEVEEASDSEVRARTVMVLVEARLGVQNIFGARCNYVLRSDAEDPTQLKIQRKEVWLTNRDHVFDNLTFLL